MPPSSPNDASEPRDRLSQLQRLVLEFRRARGWEPFHTPKNLSMGLSVEAAELQELFLWRPDAEITQALADPAFAARVAEELADVAIFLLYLSQACGVDLATAIRDKVAINAQRYPVHKCYGTHKKYTELK